MANENLSRPVTTGDNYLFIPAERLPVLMQYLQMAYDQDITSPDPTKSLYDQFQSQQWRPQFDTAGNLTGLEFFGTEWQPAQVRAFWIMLSWYAEPGAFIEYSEVGQITPRRFLIEGKGHLKNQPGWYGFGEITRGNAKSRT